MRTHADDEERELMVRLMRADIDLKTKQAFWETPRNLALIVAAAAGIAGVLGFKLGQREPTTPTTQQFILPPGTTITTPK